MPKKDANLLEAMEILSEHGTARLTKLPFAPPLDRARWLLHFYDAAHREQTVSGLTPESVAKQAMDLEDEARALPKRPDADLLLDMMKEGKFPVCPAKARKIVARLKGKIVRSA